MLTHLAKVTVPADDLGRYDWATMS